MNVYRPKISELLGPVQGSMKARFEFVNHGKLGQLLYKEGCDESVQTKRLTARSSSTGQKLMFDRRFGAWIPFNDEIVPWTYTLAPKPKNRFDELDYFIRGGGLIKHKFIWLPESTNTLTFEQFEKLKSNRNMKMHGRYTMTPHIPMITNNGIPPLN